MASKTTPNAPARKDNPTQVPVSKKKPHKDNPTQTPLGGGPAKGK